MSLADLGSQLVARVKQLAHEIRVLEERTTAAIATRREEGRKLLNVLAAAEIAVPLDAATAIGKVAKSTKTKKPVEMLPCRHCGRECKGGRGLANHEMRCPQKAA